MRQILNKYSRQKLVFATTLFAILIAQLLMYIGYNAFAIEIRSSEIIIVIIAPLIITVMVTWYLFGLLIKLDTLEKEMRNLATYDQLTNTLTRKAFFEKANEYKKIADRESKKIILMMIDLDHFKKINDTYGHITGDFVLKSFGKVLNQYKRETDLIGRFGGEEFTLLLWGANSSGAIKYADYLHDKIRNLPLHYDGNTINISVSIGISDTESSNIEIKELIDQADKALYQAKETGRNKTIVFKPKSYP